MQLHPKGWASQRKVTGKAEGGGREGGWGGSSSDLGVTGVSSQLEGSIPCEALQRVTVSLTNTVIWTWRQQKERLVTEGEATTNRHVNTAALLAVASPETLAGSPSELMRLEVRCGIICVDCISYCEGRFQCLLRQRAYDLSISLLALKSANDTLCTRLLTLSPLA